MLLKLESSLECRSSPGKDNIGHIIKEELMKIVKERVRLCFYYPLTPILGLSTNESLGLSDEQSSKLLSL